MVDTFEYRPRFVDIRVNKPEKVERAPGERPCDQIGCRGGGLHRAPKSRGADHEHGHWWFCAQHAAEYNRRWNYFEGMTDDELRDYESAERAGHRPTWAFRAARGDRLSSAYRNFEQGRRTDPFNLFRDGKAAEKARGPRHRPLGRLQLMALETLDLDERADAETVRTRYAELVKRFHPDSNGGDRSAEARLHKVIRAYQTLKSARLA